MKLEKLFLLGLVFVLALSLVSASRLPTVAGDSDSWGTILNDYLNVSHNATGELNDNVVSCSQIVDGAITFSDLDSSDITLEDFTNDANYLDKDDGGIIDGDVVINGDLSLIGGYLNATITNQYLNGSFFPTITALFDLGSLDFFWNNLYVTKIFSTDWSNVTITESQVSDLQSYITNGTNINVLDVDASSATIDGDLNVTGTSYLGSMDFSGGNITATNGVFTTLNVAGNAYLDNSLGFEGSSPSINQASSTNYVLSLNGSGYASGTGTGIFNTEVTTIKLRFKPGFAKNDGITRHFYDSTLANRYVFLKNTANNFLIYASIEVFAITYATWSPHWNDFDWNEFIIVMDEAGGGSSYVTLNGNIIASSGTAFTCSNPATIYVGASAAALPTYIGQIDYFRIYSDVGMATPTALYEFNNDYISEVSATNNLASAGTGNSFVTSGERLTVNYQTTFNSYEDAGSLTTDYLFDTSATRTAGNIFEVQNNGISKLSVDYSGSANVTGNVTADTYFGDGSQLTGIYGGNESFNQSLTDSLYSGIQWNYNQSLSTFEMWNSSWDNRGLIDSLNSSIQNINNSFNQSLTDDLYVDVAGDTMTGDLIVGSNNFSTTNVGIGTTTPSYPLDMEIVSGNTGMRIKNLEDDAYILLSSPTDEQAKILLQKVDTSRWAIGMGANTNDFVFQNYNGGAHTLLHLDYDTDYIGIGTATPSQKLEVNGSANVTGNLEVAGNITADTYFGDGSQLIGISGGNESFNQSLTDDLYVPYTGANSNTDLGNYNLTTTGTLFATKGVRADGGFSVGANPVSTIGLYAIKSYTDYTLDATGVLMQAEFNPSADSTKNLYGFYTQPAKRGANTLNGVYGTWSGALQYGTGLLSYAIGTHSFVRLSGGAGYIGNITNGRAINVGAPIQDALNKGTIINNNGVYIANQGNSFVTNAYGIYLNEVSGATSKNYNIYLAGAGESLLEDNGKWTFGTGGDSSIYYNGSDMIINPKVVGSGKLIVEGDLDVTGNITGNNHYGGMWYHNHTGTSLNFAVDGTFYQHFFVNSTHNNGFNFEGGFGIPSNLTVQVSGMYQINYMVSGDGQNNHAYFTSVYVNEINKDNCENHHKMSAGGDVITQSGTCLLRLNAGEKLSLRTADIGGTGTGNYYSSNLDVYRVGN